MRDTKKPAKPKSLLQYERELRNWTQAELADQLYNLCLDEDDEEVREISSKMIGVWERGEHVPNPYWREKLCKLLGKNAEELGLVKRPLISESPSRVLPHRQTALPRTFIRSARTRDHNTEDVIDDMPGNAAYLDSTALTSWSLLEQGNGMNRRHALALIAGTPLGLPGLAGLLQDEEILSIYSANIPVYWRLYFDGYIAEVNTVLPQCLSHLSHLASQPSFYKKQAASLASKACQLACMLALQNRKFGNALSYARQGFQYGQWAEDPNLQVASLIRKALVYFYLKRPEQKLQAYLEALQYEALVSPLLKGRIYIGLVEAHGNFGQEYEAKHFLDLGYKTLPQHPKEDPGFAYTHFSGYSRIFEVLMYLDFKQPEKAWEMLASLPVGVASDRVEFLIRQTKTLIALDDLQQSCTTLETSISSAMALGSNLRYEETRDLHQKMLMKWPKERQVKELADLFLA